MSLSRLLGVFALSLAFGCSAGTKKADTTSQTDTEQLPDSVADLTSDAGDVLADEIETDTLDSVTDGVDVLLDEVAEVDVSTGPYAHFEGSGAVIGSMLGVSSHMSRGADYSWKREAELEGLSELGFNRVRNDFHWRSIESEEGVFDVSGQSHMTDLILERGMSVLAILLSPPEWAQTDGTYDSVDPEKWRTFVHYTVEHLMDRIHSWEIWNEPNLDVFWTPDINPYLYGVFTKVAYEEIHALDPDAEVVFGTLSSFQFHTENIWGFVLDVAKFHPDICDYFDSLSIHPYSFAQQYSPEYNFVQGVYVHPPMAGLIEEARVVLAEIGCPNRPIHLTECGWPHYYMGEDKQGAFAVRGLLLAASAGAASYHWYTYWDSIIGPDQPAPTEDTFGLMTPPESAENPGERKPAFYSMKGASIVLGDTRFAGDLGKELGWEEPLYALAFADDQGQFIVAVWQDQDDLELETAVEIPMPEGATSWTRYDYTGTEVESGTSNPAPVAATGWVNYLKFE